MTKSNIIAYAKVLCTIGTLSLMTACGTMGGTNVLSLDITPPQQLESHLEFGSLALGEDATKLESFGVFRWGEFSQDDLQNMQQSAKNTFARMQAAAAVKTIVDPDFETLV